MANREEAVEQLVKAHAAPRCGHFKADGDQCGSPAMRGGDYCYYHINYMHTGETLFLPPIEDGNALQIILHGILQALRDDRIDSKKAGQMLWALQIAAANLPNTTMQPDLNLARQLTAMQKRSELRREDSLLTMKARIDSQLAAAKELVQHRYDVTTKDEREYRAKGRAEVDAFFGRKKAPSVEPANHAAIAGEP